MLLKTITVLISLNVLGNCIVHIVIVHKIEAVEVYVTGSND